MTNINDVYIGRHIFDSLTTGMYENPLCIYREYIQNSADALDKAIGEKTIKLNEAEITINIDPPNGTIRIFDNGCGIPLLNSSQTLLSIGNSNKSSNHERGFRGIGRLGGMAYAEELIFRTKAYGETKVTVNSWDCRKIKSMLDRNKKKDISIQELVSECSIVAVEEDNGDHNDSYFCVEMKGVTCNKNVLLDIRAVREYIAAVSPIPFDYQKFPFGRNLDAKYHKAIPSFNTFRISVNTSQIFKPYGTSVKIGKDKVDEIIGCIENDITDENGKLLAYAWHADREHLNAQIVKGENVEGIRVRVGNIMIGDRTRLNEIFREERFNSWCIGEVNVVDDRLIPNSRRDDFEDNAIRDAFYTALRRIVGEPISIQIRLKSKERSKNKQITAAQSSVLEVKGAAKKGFVGTAHKKDALKKLGDAKAALRAISIPKNDEDAKTSIKKKIDEIESIEDGIKQNASYDMISKMENLSKIEKEIFQHVADSIYTNYNKSSNAVDLVEKVLKSCTKNR